MKNIFDIWRLNFIEIEFYEPYIDILSHEEYEKACRFHYEKEKKNYILTHAYLRLILTQYISSIKPLEWKFKRNDFGKPYIDNVLHEHLYFNLSHTDSVAYFVISSDEMCGIDVEDVVEIELDDDYLNMVLSDHERIEFENAGRDLNTFYTFWTRKEAFLKAKGIGLIDGLKEISGLQCKTLYCGDENKHIVSYLIPDECDILPNQISIHEKKLKV